MGNNTTVVIAGPGAGKTHNMVDRVLTALNYIKANKFCCVITYTNAATDEIRNRISNEIDIPPNLFIGTIHSFLIRFILEPYAHILDLCNIEKSYIENVQVTLPQYVGTIPKKVFCKIDGISKEQSNMIREELIQKKILNKYKGQVNISFNFKPDNPSFNLILDSAPGFENEVVELIKKRHNSSAKIFKERNQKLKRTEILFNNSVFTYDQILQTSKDIIDNDLIKENITSRISNLFVDEYQDLRLIQHQVLEKLFSSDKVKSYIIGDPFQYIFNFTYHQSLIEEKSPLFDETPLIQMRDANTVINDNNYRSTREIIEFVNNFTEFKQDPNKSYESNIQVSLINSLENCEIKRKFEELITTKNIVKEKGKIYKALLFYSTKSDKVKHLITEFNSSETTNNKLSQSLYKSIEQLILSSIGYKKNEFIEKYDLKIIEFRKLCLGMYKILKLKYNTLNDNKHLMNYIADCLKRDYKIEKKKDLSTINIDALISNLFDNKKETVSEFIHSTIHKFKGLEATCVLVVAKTKNELNGYITTELEEIKKAEKKRLGYVAFSRARKFLCIACLEKIDEDTKKKLEMLKVKIL